MILGPRLVIAGTHSGVGKTTVATGLMAAFAARGLQVASAKVGPDYIDPGYHGLATGRPGRNLDPWMCGEESIGPLAGRAAAGADVLVVEGVMGLFDGAGRPSGGAMVGSSAHVARLIDAPVVLVVDAASMSGSVAALVRGFASFDRATRVAGIVLNRVGSDHHEDLLREALAPEGIPVMGALRRDPALEWRDRHLGLIPVVEHRAAIEASLDRLRVVIDARCDLAALEALARRAPHRPVHDVRLPPQVVPGVRIAVAGGPAFTFTYPDNVEALAAAGAEPVPFDPLTDRRLPEGSAALIAGGGFPEVYGPDLAANRPLLDDVREKVRQGLPTWAECGGLLWLAETLDGTAMAGAVPCAARMTPRLTLGYRRVRLRVDTPIGPAGGTLRGHEFHYSSVDPAGDALCTEGTAGRGQGGFASPSLLASYVHVHLGAAPDVAATFVEKAFAYATGLAG